MRSAARMASIAATLCLASPNANARDLLSGGLLVSETSDGFDRTELFVEYRSARRETFWPWEESPETDLDWGARFATLDGRATRNFMAERAELMLAKRFSPELYIEAWGGAHRLDAGTVHNENPYRVDLRINPLPALAVHVYTADDLVYDDGVLPAGVTEGLTARDHGAGLDWRIGSVWRLDLNGNSRRFSDGNVQHHASAALLYGISPEWPWIWLGISGETLNSDRTVEGYWSPENFTARGVTFESNFPVTESFNAAAAFSLNSIDEDGAEAQGQSASLGFESDFDGNLVLRGGASRINTLQSGREWFENTYTLTLSGGLR